MSRLEYTVDRILEHKGRGRNRHSIVKWYEWGPENDTQESAKDIPRHLITRYHGWKNQRQASARNKFRK